MSVLLKKLKETIANYFGSRMEFGSGVSAPCQKLAWLFKMKFELNPKGLGFWQDLSNGFNAISRKSIQHGLMDLPESLQWLRRSFEKFYHGQTSLYFKREDGELDEVFCEGGINQGDSASGLFFNVGLMATWC